MLPSGWDCLAGTRTPAKIYVVFAWLVENKGDPKKEKNKKQQRGTDSGEDWWFGGVNPWLLRQMGSCPLQTQVGAGPKIQVSPDSKARLVREALDQLLLGVVRQMAQHLLIHRIPWKLGTPGR